MAKLMIVGEMWGPEDEELGRPFSGTAGKLLNSLLHAAGIPRHECYLTCVFNIHPPGNKLSYFGGPKTKAIPGYPRLANKLYINKAFIPELDRLWREIEDQKPNVILALGPTALWALTKKLGIKHYRGAPLPAFQNNYKVIPTYHPSAILRQWSLRPIVLSDILKAKAEAEFPEISRPQRFIYMEPTLKDLETFYEKFIIPAPELSVDIETKQNTITEIGFAPSIDRVLVVPFYDYDNRTSYWPTASAERKAWEWVRRVLAEKPLIGQNFCYDLQQLWFLMGIPTPEIADDTMLMHHSLYPELEKSLGMLASLYTNEPSWKFMRKNRDNYKAED